MQASASELEVALIPDEVENHVANVVKHIGCWPLLQQTASRLLWMLPIVVSKPVVSYTQVPCLPSRFIPKRTCWETHTKLCFTTEFTRLFGPGFLIPEPNLNPISTVLNTFSPTFPEHFDVGTGREIVAPIAARVVAAFRGVQP